MPDNQSFDTKQENIFDPDGALSRSYLLARGYCCQNGCRNCPYGFRSFTNQQSREADSRIKEAAAD